MDIPHPMDAPGRRQCKARSRQSGQRCKRRPIPGGFVCVMHGGKTPIARQKAAERVRDVLADAIDPNRAMREAACVAYSDIRELYDDNDQMLPIKQWPEHIARAVKSIERETVRGNLDKGDGKFDDVLRTKVQLWDKPRKIENLMKHHGQLTEKREVNVNVNIVGRLMEGRKRVAALRGAQQVVVEGKSDVIDAEAKLLTDGRRSG